MAVDEKVQGALFSDATLVLGEIHWAVLKAARAMDRERWDKVKREFGSQYEDTAFGKEVGMDEIHWWIFEKEPDVDELLAKTEEALSGTGLEKRFGETQGRRAGIVREIAFESQGLCGATSERSLRIARLRDVVCQPPSHGPTHTLHVPCMGVSRMADRDMDVDNEETARSDMSKLRTVTEIVLGLRHRGWLVYETVNGELAYEMYESMDPEETPDDAVIIVPEQRVVRRTAYDVYENCATYFTETRDSLRNIIVDIRKFREQRELFQNDKFWREFILKACKAKTSEPQSWDFKETLTVWHVKNGEERRKAKVAFAEDVASFANTSGGVLVIGVNDKREIVGIGEGRELENRLKVAREVLAAHIDHDREIASFRQVVMGEKSEEKICLVVVISQACKPVGVSDGKGRFSYPVRRETGISRVSREDVPVGKLHLKSDNRDFMRELAQFVRDN